MSLTRPTHERGFKGLLRLVWRCALFAVLNAVLAVIVLKAHESTLHYARWETDSNLLIMPESEHREVVILGTSHAYVCARFQKHQLATERELGRTVFNMAIAQGGGITLRGTDKRIKLHRRNASGNVETVEPDMSLPLQSDDVVYVRESLF